MSFNEWHRVSIKDVFELIPGFAFKSKDFSENGIPVIKIKNVKALRLLDRDFSYIDPKYLETKSRFTTKKGDLLISMTGNRIEGSMSSWVGKVCRINSDKKYLINQRVGILRLSNESYSDKFFLYLLGSEEIQKKLISIATSSGGQANISPDQIKSLEFSIPCFEEQNAIAHILSTLDDKIEVNNQINKTLENMAQAIFKQWFVDFEFPNEDGEPYKSSGGEMVESELGLIPKGWEVKPFEDAFYFQEGPGIRNWQYVENGTKFINIRCIQDNDLYLETANMISFEEAEGKYKHFMIDSGDIVMSTSGTLGRYAIVREEHLPLCLNTSVIRFKPLHGQEHYSYMYAYLTSNEFLNHLTTKASGSVQKNFGPMHLRQIKLLYPNVSIIKLLNAIISPIIKSSLHTKKENDKLKKLRDTLLPKLMSGEIRVPLDEEGDAS